jgi:hypothetical protein
MTCVVCGASVVEPHYANAWEKVRKLYPCCSSACSARFDPDTHWLPAAAPAPAAGPEAARLLGVARDRVRAGDKPTIVVRDLLLAGVGLPGVRKLLLDAEIAAKSTDRVVTQLNIISVIRALFRGPMRMRMHERRDRQDPEALRAAVADLDAWRARFDQSPALGGRGRASE